MPGRNESEAWRAFREPIERTVGCVDQTVRLNARRFTDTGVWLLASPQETGIEFGPALTLTFSLSLKPVVDDGIWRMTTLSYTHTVALGSEPTKTVFGWHWHPASRRSRITYPHVHVPSATQFSTRHIPTGRVTLEDVVLFGFDELGVQPAHPDARSIVEGVRERHRQFRSWH